MHLFQRTLTSTYGLALLLATAACSSKNQPAPAPQPESLYVRMGGKASIESITDQLVANVGAEAGQPSSILLRSHKPMLDAISSLNGQAPTDPTRLQCLRNNVVDQFTDITGGPIKYMGKNMLVAHTGMAVTTAEYVTWRTMLDNSLATNKIGATEKTQFTALIDAMKNDVVNH